MTEIIIKSENPLYPLIQNTTLKEGSLEKLNDRMYVFKGFSRSKKYTQYLKESEAKELLEYKVSAKQIAKDNAEKAAEEEAKTKAAKEGVAKAKAAADAEEEAKGKAKKEAAKENAAKAAAKAAAKNIPGKGK